MKPKQGWRPRKTPTGDGKRVGLSLRVTAELKRRLDAAADASGRSLSQEAELMMEIGQRSDAVGKHLDLLVMLSKYLSPKDAA